MKFKDLLSKKKTIIVAEIGNNHEGNFDVAAKLIDKAAKCGVDAVKFQTFIPKYFISNDYNKKAINKLKKFQLSFQQFEKLSIIAKRKNLLFFSTPLDLKSAIFLNKIQDVFKISSGDNDFVDLLKKVFSFNKSTIISTGLSEISSLKKTYSLAKKYFKNKTDKKLIFLHCVTDYPVEDKYVNLNSINILKKNFPNLNIGYSDHSLGIRACSSAIPLGVKLIEKHFTLDNNFSDFRDHKISLSPHSMKILVDEIRNIELIMGQNKKIIQTNEKKNLINARRSYASIKNIKKNQKILRKDLIMLRPRLGFTESNEKRILGKKLRKNVKAGYIIRDKMLKQ